MESAFDIGARLDLSDVGNAIGEPSRAAMLVALMDGTARPASDLARIAGITPATATSHLKRLLDAGLVVVRQEGRHRYYRLRDGNVAALIESMVASVRDIPAPKRARSGPSEALKVARTCYGHLAGRLSIAFWARVKRERWAIFNDSIVELSPSGARLFVEWGLLDESQVALVGRDCPDWSERVPHVSGALGVALCAALLHRGWVAPTKENRALRVTARGRERFEALGIRWDGRP